MAAQNMSTDAKVFPKYDYPLKFEIIKECSVSKARCSRLTLPHATLGKFFYPFQNLNELFCSFKFIN